MTRFMVFGRREYSEPLELVGEIESEGTPTVEEAGGEGDWLELVVFPVEETTWVVRGASLVEDRRGVPA